MEGRDRRYFVASGSSCGLECRRPTTVCACRIDVDQLEDLRMIKGLLRRRVANDDLAEHTNLIWPDVPGNEEDIAFRWYTLTRY